MNLTLDELIQGIRNSRGFFFKHLNGLTDEQWDWKPYPECKSLRETLAHLVVDDRAAIQTIANGGEPDYDGLAVAAMTEAGGDLQRQIAIVKQTHEELIALLQKKFANTPVDAEMTLWSMTGKLATLIPYLSSEDFYHAGQAAYIRMATDPSWNYYEAVYGEG